MQERVAAGEHESLMYFNPDEQTISLVPKDFIDPLFYAKELNNDLAKNFQPVTVDSQFRVVIPGILRVGPFAEPGDLILTPQGIRSRAIKIWPRKVWEESRGGRSV